MERLSDFQFIGQLATGLFLSIVFLQSSLDKIFDWKGNLEWLKGHFAKTILSSVVVPMLATLTLVELAAGIVSLCGVGCLLICGDPSCILYGVEIALAAFLMLLFGQRIAKDYAGAQTIAIYFGVTLISLLFFS